ncbi:MAG TPA: copper resistance CopC/CopD family protein [Kaistia sp.]|nr:copper resistance CopC/CopD family protein [Kaistia sp.]
MVTIATGWTRVLLTVLVLVSGLLAAGEALAHASLIRASPVDGSVVATAPPAFSLTFSEPTSPLSLKLVRPDGSTAALDRFTLRDATVEIPAPAGLGNGTYVLSWRVVSEDGHPIGGSAVFSIGAPSAGGSKAAVEAIDVPVGGAFFVSLAGGEARSRRFCAGWILAGFVAVPLSLGFQGLDALGLPIGSILQPVVWKTGFGTSLGTLACLALAALIAAFAALSTGGASSKLLSFAALALTGVALASSGHASAAHPGWLTRPAVFLHGVGITFWAGALFPLALALASPAPEAATALRRFSKLAPWFVLPLIGAGLLLALVQVRVPEALWTTTYGLVLLTKLALLIPLFGLALFNRLRLTEPAGKGDARAIAQLRRSIAAELLLVVMIFAVAAFWRFTPPPRALAEAAAAPAAIHIHAAQAMADLEIAPGRAGVTSATISVMTGDFGPLDAQGVTLVLSNPDAGIEAIRREAKKPGDGTWRIDDLTLPVAGRWHARIDILVSDFELVKLEDVIEIRP